VASGSSVLARLAVPARWRSRRLPPAAWIALSLGLGAGLWQVTGLFVHDSLFWVPFSAVAQAEIAWFADGSIWPHLWVSAQELLIGFGCAIVAGTAIGGVMGMSRLSYNLLNPWVALLYATPLVAIVPLYILVFGIDVASKAALVFTVCVFTIVVNTVSGFHAAQRRYVDLARSYGATRVQMVWKVLFPSALPFILAGYKLAIGRGLIGVVVGEFVIARAGIGFMISQAGQTFQMAQLYAGVVLLAVFGLLSFQALELLERTICPWRGH
jgi:ABC-type nitrate/sulfonate/bicarbonate transport system permease component